MAGNRGRDNPIIFPCHDVYQYGPVVGGIPLDQMEVTPRPPEGPVCYRRGIRVVQGIHHEGRESVGLSYLEHLLERRSVGHVVPVGQLHSLGRACRAGGEDDDLRGLAVEVTKAIFLWYLAVCTKLL